MAKKKSGAGNKSATPTTSQSIQKKTEEYLKNGGRINVIETGVTGLNYLKTSKHINISGNKEKVLYSVFFKSILCEIAIFFHIPLLIKLYRFVLKPEQFHRSLYFSCLASSWID